MEPPAFSSSLKQQHPLIVGHKLLTQELWDTVLGFLDAQSCGAFSLSSRAFCSISRAFIRTLKATFNDADAASQAATFLCKLPCCKAINFAFGGRAFSTRGDGDFNHNLTAFLLAEPEHIASHITRLLCCPDLDAASTALLLSRVPRLEHFGGSARRSRSLAFTCLRLHVPALTSLDISVHSLVPEDAGGLSALTSLTSLTVHCQHSSTSPEGGVRLTLEPLSSLISLRQLRILSSYMMSEPLEAELHHLSSLTHLETLRIGGCPRSRPAATTAALRRLQHLTQLQKLELMCPHARHGVDLSFASISCVSPLTALTHIAAGSIVAAGAGIDADGDGSAAAVAAVAAGAPPPWQLPALRCIGLQAGRRFLPLKLFAALAHCCPKLQQIVDLSPGGSRFGAVLDVGEAEEVLEGAEDDPAAAIVAQRQKLSDDLATLQHLAEARGVVSDIWVRGGAAGAVLLPQAAPAGFGLPHLTGQLTIDGRQAPCLEWLVGVAPNMSAVRAAGFEAAALVPLASLRRVASLTLLNVRLSVDAAAEAAAAAAGDAQVGPVGSALAAPLLKLVGQLVGAAAGPYRGLGAGGGRERPAAAAVLLRSQRPQLAITLFSPDINAAAEREVLRTLECVLHGLGYTGVKVSQYAMAETFEHRPNPFEDPDFEEWVFERD